jgi:uncharacterized protein YkwD
MIRGRIILNKSFLKKSCGLVLSATTLFTAAKSWALTSADMCFDRIGIVDRTVSQAREEICLRVNQERSSRAYAKLEMDPVLTKVAQTYAEEMARGNFFDHVTPRGGTFRTRLEKGNVAYQQAGENIARGQDTAQIVHVQWMHSEGHRHNILTPAFRKIGVGSYKKYWVQVFTN